jgi:hypothetical protein
VIILGRDGIWIVMAGDGVAKKKRNKVVVVLFLCALHKFVFLIPSIKQINCHVSFIGRKTGKKGG